MTLDWHLDIENQKPHLILKNDAEFDASVEIPLTRYRMLIILQNLRDVPRDLDPQNKNFYLEYTIFDTTIRYKFDINSAYCSEYAPRTGIVIPLVKARLFYFFGQERNSLRDFLIKQGSFRVSLIVENLAIENPAERVEKIGTVEFPLRDFLSDKITKRDFLKLFAGKSIPILTWALQITIGIIESGEERLSKGKLTDYMGVQYTTSDYYTCETFPKEWIQIFLKNQDPPRTQSRNGRLITDPSVRVPIVSESPFPRGGSFTPVDSVVHDQSINALLSSKQKPLESRLNISATAGMDEVEDEEVDDNLTPVEAMMLAEIRDLEKRVYAPKPLKKHHIIAARRRASQGGNIPSLDKLNLSSYIN
jgi:LMBR1 domain-containing protein 1